MIVVGLIIAGIGVVWLIASSIPWLGRLPDDIAVERENFHFPLTISLLLTGIMLVGSPPSHDEIPGQLNRQFR